ncbi:MAG: TetR/AcrR family transcriptional regulator [Burkholderiaceae bacterium]
MKSIRNLTDPPSAASYHHGNLRQALIRAALAADSLETVSLRQLAASLGVSAAAVYRHFESKDHLLDALADVGFERLYERFEAACPLRAPATGPAQARQRLTDLAIAYLEFAAHEAALWRLMFGPLAAARRSAGAPAGRPNTYEYLPAALHGLHRAGVIPSAPTESDVLFAWSTIHGLAMLRAGRVGTATGDIASVANAMTSRMLRGLAADR